MEIDAAVAGAVRHFRGSIAIFARLPTIHDAEDAYALEMGFMHAMQSAQASLEQALLRILGLCGEEAPTGPRWHADLVARAAHPVGERVAILSAETGRAAEETRRFRSIATDAHDSFDHSRATGAVEGAAPLVSLLPAEIAHLRKAVDP